jgi:cell wall assembly regulator SMI1
MAKAKSARIRRFVHPDGSWSNLIIADGKVVQFSGVDGATVPYFGKVKEESFAPPKGGKVDAEIERLVADLTQRKFVEVSPTKKPAGEKKIDGLWRRLENWFCDNVPAFCRWPLAPGASEADVRKFEQTIGAKLPDDIRRSYLRHNGSAGIDLLDVVGEGKWATLAQATANWRHFQKMKPDLEEAGFLNSPKGPMKEVNISPGWIPIGDNGGGDHLCVDLDPAKGGTVGQLFSYWHEYGAWRIVAPSITAFLEQLLKHLDAGRYAINEQGQLVPGDGPEPGDVEPLQEYFLEEADFPRWQPEEDTDATEADAVTVQGRIETLTGMLDADPNNLAALNELAWLLATASDETYRDGHRALTYAQRIFELATGDDANDPNHFETLAAAHAEVGNFEKAVESQNRAVELYVEEGDEDLIEWARELLVLYGSGKTARG